MSLSTWSVDQGLGWVFFDPGNIPELLFFNTADVEMLDGPSTKLEMELGFPGFSVMIDAEISGNVLGLE
jgi:hypothetical protein